MCSSTNQVKPSGRYFYLILVVLDEQTYNIMIGSKQPNIDQNNQNHPFFLIKVWIYKTITHLSRAYRSFLSLLCIRTGQGLTMGTHVIVVTQLIVWPQAQKTRGDCNQGRKDPQLQQFRGSVGLVSDLQQNQSSAHLHGKDSYTHPHHTSLVLDLTLTQSLGTWVVEYFSLF